MGTDSGTHGARLVELDALRGLAALAVTLFHVTSRYDVVYGHNGTPLFGVPWGHFGVQLFFAISGFVIFMTLRRTKRPMDFAVSRFSRLYPAYWAAILVTTLAMLPGELPELSRPAWVIGANLTMVHGLFDIPSVDEVYWTLLVELAFYGCMFALYMARQLDRIELILFGWIGLKWVWAATALAGIELPYRIGLLLIQTYVPFFAIGILAYRFHAGDRAFRQILPPLVFALATIAALDGTPHLVVGLVATAALFGIARRGLKLLHIAPLAWLGTISYTLYLVHENIGWTVIHRLERAGVDTNASIAAALVVVLAVASAITYAVERPAMRAIRRLYASGGRASIDRA